MPEVIKKWVKNYKEGKEKEFARKERKVLKYTEKV